MISFNSTFSNRNASVNETQDCLLSSDEFCKFPVQLGVCQGATVSSQGRHFGPFAPDDLSDIVTSCLFINVFLDFTMEIPTSKYSASEFPGINKALWFSQIAQRKILFLNIVHGFSIIQSGKSGVF